MMANPLEDFYYVYILQSEKDGKKYAGYTNDLPSRFEAHQKGEVKSTKHRRPLKLIYFEACLNQKDALKREKYFKTHYGNMYLGNRLKSYLSCEGMLHRDFTGQVNQENTEDQNGN